MMIWLIKTMLAMLMLKDAGNADAEGGWYLLVML